MQDRAGRSHERQTFWSGIMLGIGTSGTLDEVILHQLLHWHHFYDRSTPAVGLVSDGLFHIASTALLVIGMYRLRNDRGRTPPGWLQRLCGSMLVGAGGFNLYDGVVQHKLLKLHQVRPGVANELPYDVAFIGLAIVLLSLGVIVLRRAPPVRPAGSPTR